MRRWYRMIQHDVIRWGWAVAWSNLRFNLGYKIGGFTSARRDNTTHDGSWMKRGE